MCRGSEPEHAGGFPIELDDEVVQGEGILTL